VTGKGERTPFQRLFDAHCDEVHGFLVRFLKDPTLAEDALQETFLSVHAKQGERDTERSARAWIFRIAHNAAIDLMRRRQKQERLADAEAHSASEPQEDTVAAEVERRERVAHAREALSVLSDEDRALLLLRHGQGMKLAELADCFGCTERTVRNRLRRAATELAQAVLTREGRRA